MTTTSNSYVPTLPQTKRDNLDNLFPSIIGQHPTKRKFEFYIKAFERIGITPNILITAPKGAGKTMLARAFARNLVMPNTMEPKRYIEINCATIKNLRQFVDMIMTPYMINTEATFLFDECHMIPKDVTMALLTITNPNKENHNTFSYDGQDFDIDFKKLTFLFATTEPQEVFHALIDRMERIDLDDYSYDELGQILLLNTDKIKFSGDLVFKRIAPTLRGNGRSAQKMATNIINYCAGNNVRTFKLKDWESLCKTLDILPHGLNKNELKYLKTLVKNGCTRLYNLAAKLQMTRAAIQSDCEVYLQKLNFIESSAHGRQLTGDAKAMFEKHPELLDK
jgi:Holliday junction resolvasome RuvABC ATP-dependent DNA helicase subunit